MSVETPQIKIDPYKSEVPMAPVVTPTQTPVQDSAPASRIYSRAGGIAEIADMGLKGFLKGLQTKEEKKFKVAQATMASQDAAIKDSDKRYTDALMMYGKDDERTKAAWSEKTNTVNKAADLYQKYAVPEKTAKTPKGQKKSKTAPDGAPAAGGFGANIKQFLSRNPQLIPELAIIGIRSQIDPKLYGQMTPEMTQQKQQMDLESKKNANAQVETAARGVFDKYAGVDPDKLKSMPSSNPKMFASAYEEFENAKAVITPPSRAAGKYQVFVDENKQEHYVQEGDQIPPGWNLKEKTAAGSTPKVGTEQEFTSQALKGYGYTAENAPAPLLKYIHDEWQYRAPQGTSSTSSSTVDVSGNRTSTTRSSRGASAPKPPSGFSPIGANGIPQKQSGSGETPKRVEEGRNLPAQEGVGAVGESNPVLQQVLSEYPGLAKNFNANNTSLVFASGDRQKRGSKERGGLEFWPPEGEPVESGGDSTYPTPQLGKNVLEVYDNNLKNNPEELKKAITGDLLHGMNADPYWKNLRDQFMRNFTPQERKRQNDAETWWDDVNGDRHAEQHGAIGHFSGNGTYDAYIRGWLFNEGDGKAGQKEQGNTMYSPKQIQILQKMQDYLKTGNTSIDGGARTGRITRPPSAPRSMSSPSRGRMTAPPEPGGRKTLTTANREGRVSTEEKGMYDKATNAYQKQLNLNRSKAADPASLQKLNEQAMNDYNAAKAQIVLWKAGQIKAVGGDPWKHQANDSKGNTYGTMDGVNWVNIKTGYPYQE